MENYPECKELINCLLFLQRDVDRMSSSARLIGHASVELDTVMEYENVPMDQMKLAVVSTFFFFVDSKNLCKMATLKKAKNWFSRLPGPPGFTCWISFAPVFSFIYC